MGFFLEFVESCAPCISHGLLNRLGATTNETKEHEIILANGVPAETFIDNVSRRVFDNYAEFDALFGDVPEMEELPYPRAISARQVPERIRTMLARVTAA